MTPQRPHRTARAWAGDDGVVEAAHDPGHVLHRLPLAQLDVSGDEVGDAPAEALEARLEAGAGPQQATFDAPPHPPRSAQDHPRRCRSRVEKPSRPHGITNCLYKKNLTCPIFT